MSILGKVWGGPFKAPPMVQPVSVGWVFLKILETVWRALLVVCALVALIFAAIWASERNPLSSQITAEFVKGSTACTDNTRPLYVLLTNKSKKTIGEIGLNFRVYQLGRSQDIASYSASHPELRDIYQPGAVNGYCFSMPTVEPGRPGPYSVAVGVTYAGELSKDVPADAQPPLIRTKGFSSPTTTSWWGKVVTGLVVLLFFGMVLVGGYTLVALVDRVFKTSLLLRLNGDEGGIGPLFAASGLNAAIVVGGSYVLGALGWDGWLNDLDAWSRSTTLADGGIMLLTGLACQWPWVVMLALLTAKPDHTRSAD